MIFLLMSGVVLLLESCAETSVTAPAMSIATNATFFVIYPSHNLGVLSLELAPRGAEVKAFLRRTAIVMFGLGSFNACASSYSQTILLA